MIDVYSDTIPVSEEERTGIARAAQAALDREGRDGDLTILIDTPERIQTLNREFRNVDAVTDVLSGDADFAVKCEKRINRLLEGGTTLLLVSHNLGDIRKYCTRVVRMDHGRVVADGSTESVLGAAG